MDVPDARGRYGARLWPSRWFARRVRRQATRWLSQLSPDRSCTLWWPLRLSSLGMDVADAWLSSFFAQQGFALPVDFAMGLSAFAFAACALLPLRAWLASRMGLHAYLLVYFCSKVSALMLMRLVPAGASLSTAAIFGVALASILILLLVAVHLKRGHADGSVEYGGSRAASEYLACRS